MKSGFIYKPLIVLLAATTFLFTSCTNSNWDDHYFTEVTTKSDLHIYNYIHSQSNLSIFDSMLKIAGMDSILNQSQTFTVWAPTNTALAGVNLNDTALVRQIVKNHIARFSIQTAGVDQLDVMMLNGKMLSLAKGDASYTLQGKAIKNEKTAAYNGIVYQLDTYVPYIMNLWEYIQYTEGLDSLRHYVNSLSAIKFDETLSYQDGVLVDSIFTMSNKVLSVLAELQNENKNYTALLPNNQAWKEAYDKINPYYKTMDSEGGPAVQRANTEWTIIKDLFFEDMDKQLLTDSLLSTFKTKITNPAEIFANATEYANSNGKSYVTGSLKFKPAETWLKPIVIEAESDIYGRTTGNYKITESNSYGSGMNVSGNKYILATSQSTLSFAKLFINFPIPNTLSGKYNIYAVFVPAYIGDTANQKVYKIKFSLNYNYKTIGTRDSVWAAGDNTIEPAYAKSGTFTTDPKTVTKMLVLQNYEFPFSNLYTFPNQKSQFSTSSKIRVGLRIENAAGTTAAEKLKYLRDIRMDCLILEPVIE